jgi:hypothetical protein
VVLNEQPVGPINDRSPGDASGGIAVLARKSICRNCWQRRQIKLVRGEDRTSRPPQRQTDSNRHLRI